MVILTCHFITLACSGSVKHFEMLMLYKCPINIIIIIIISASLDQGIKQNNKKRLFEVGNSILDRSKTENSHVL